MSVRYYSDWSPDAANEISADQTGDCRYYSRACYSDGGSLAQTEMHYEGTLVHVMYYSDDHAAIRAEHLRDHPGVRFSVFREVLKIDGFNWVFRRNYSGDGELREFRMHLNEEDDRDLEIMNLLYGLDGGVRAISKFFHGPDDQLIYCFEYDNSGRNVLVFDGEELENVPLDDVVNLLPDPGFYRTGYALPQEIAGMSIPSPAEFMGDG